MQFEIVEVVIMLQTRLKELREAAGYKSQQALADALGISQSTVGNWESGRRSPKRTTAIRLAKFFGVSVDYLLGLTDQAEVSVRVTVANHLAQSAKEQLAAEGQDEEKPTPGDGDGQGKSDNVVRIAGRDGSFYERKVSDAQREMLVQILDNLKSVDDENV